MEKVAKIGIKKKDGVIYFIDTQGDVSCYNKNQSEDRSMKVAKTGIKCDPRFYYYIDDRGDISRTLWTKELDYELIESKKQMLLQAEIQKIKERELKLNTRLEAERIVFGKAKRKRDILSEEEKELIFHKFNNNCAVCGAKEGLHIHHKDKNSSNNQIKNLIVLCGVCHKKIHMTTR